MISPPATASLNSLLSIVVISVGILVAAGIWFFFHNQKKKKILALENEEIERRKRRETRRANRKKNREEAIAEAHKARKRGDRRPVVLVVDDSSTIIGSIKKTLEERQYRVVVAANGRDAWSALQDLKPDIVVSDIEMPLMDGLTLLRMIRLDIDLANLPVILMSANAAAMVEAGKQDGVSGLLAKPFDDRDLIGQIRFLLQEA